MRPATPYQPRRDTGARRWLALGTVALLGLSAIVAAGLVRPGQLFDARHETVLVLTAKGTPARADLDRAAYVISERLGTAGYQPARVTVTGPRTLTVRVADADPAVLRRLVGPGRVSLRAILGGPVTPDPAPRRVPTADPRADTLEAVKQKLGSAYALAARLTNPPDAGDPNIVALQGFGALSRDEVGLLPPLVQFVVPAIGCAALGTGTTDGSLVACQPGTGKYLLAPPGIDGSDISGATVVLDPYAGWSVRLRFTDAGQARWTGLVNAIRGNPVSRRLAVVVDGEILTTRGIDDPGTADGLITRYGLNPAGANVYAALLGTGPLPVAFDN